MLTRKFSWSVIFALVLVFFSVLASLAESSQPEQPQHFVNVSGIACTTPEGPGYVDFMVWSWAAESPKGDNPEVSVQYQIETADGYVTGYTDYMTGTFSSENHYRFGSTLHVTGDVKRVTLIVTALGEWGDGRDGGQMTYLELFPADCDGTTADPVKGEPMTNRLFLPNVQRSGMVPLLLLVAPAALFGGAGKREGR